MIQLSSTLSKWYTPPNEARLRTQNILPATRTNGLRYVLLILFAILAGMLAPINSQFVTCEAGQEPDNSTGGCRMCGMGKFSQDGLGCRLCQKLQFQSCEGQRDCKFCPGGTKETEDRKECETAREINPEYFREVELFNPKKQNNICSGQPCLGVCAKFDVTRRQLNNSCPDYYILSWTENEGRLPSETTVNTLNSVVLDAIAINNNTDILLSKDSNGILENPKVWYVGIPTLGCGMKYATRPDYPLSPNWKKTKENTGVQEVHEYCIHKEDTPTAETVEMASFSVTLEAVVENKRGTPFTFTPQWETAPGCTGDMYLNNTHHALRDWRCYSCPDGGDCSGDKTWSEVKAKFGFYRLDPYDAGVVNQTDWPDVFWQCAEPEACLGGENENLEAQYKIAVLGSDMPEILEISGRKEMCNDYTNMSYGYRQLCGPENRTMYYPNGKTNRCLLCRACALGYFPSGLRRCLPCPPWYFQFIGGIAAVCFVIGTLFVFLKAALDSDSSPHAHLAQPLQKIVLNHLQLVSLSSSFPLKWPKVITSMFDIFENLANAAAFIFQPQCTRTAAEDAAAAGKSTFFFKQLWVLLMPFLAVLMSIIFWTIWEAKSFGLFINELKEKAAEKARIKPLTAAELFKMFHRFAMEDHKHLEGHKHKHRHRHHAHHDRLSHHGVHDMLFTICHDHRHAGMNLHLSSKKEFDKIFAQLNPAADDQKVEFASFIRWYNENVMLLVEEKIEKKKMKIDSEEMKFDLAVHIANEALEIHMTLTVPIDDTTGNIILRIDDKSRTGKATLKGLNLSLPQGEFENMIGEGLTKKQRRKSLLELKEKRAAEAAAEKKQHDSEDDTAVKVAKDLLCELRVENCETMELQILAHSEHHEIHIGEENHSTGDTVPITHGTLIVVGETEVLFDIVRRGIYKNLHSTGHKSSTNSSGGDGNKVKRKGSITEKSMIEEKIQAQMHAPTRTELEIYFKGAREKRKNDGDIAFPGLTMQEFEHILRKHPEIFGHLWPKVQVRKCYENMESHVADVISGAEGKQDPTEDDHFRAFEEFAFHFFMERRHHLRKLEIARERHDARRRSTTLDTRLLAADKAKRMGYIDKVVATVITLIYLLYPTLCKSAFSLVACRQIGLIGKSYLTQDLQIECFAEEHLYWFLGLCVPALLILIIGLPGMAMVFLWRSRHSLHRRHIRFRFSILFIGYEDRTYFWEIVVAGRKLTVSAISVFLLQVDTATQVLTAELFVVCVLVMHLHVRPYIAVTPKHNTLQHVETFALTTAFITLVSGMLMFEDIGAGNAFVEYFFTFAVLAINISFIFAAFWWWLTLKLMDLENLLEHTSATKALSTKVAEFLRKIVPDWESEGQQLEIEQEQAEAVDDLQHVNLDKLMRVQTLAHKWVVKFKAGKGEDVSNDASGSGNGTTKVHPADASGSMLSVVDQAAEKAHEIEETSNRAARKFMKQMEDRVAKAHDRLETRKRRRSSIADPNTKLFVVPDGVGLNDMGFKLKTNQGKVVVYGMEIDSPAYSVGVRNGSVLMRCNQDMINDKNLVVVLKNADRPLKLVFSARQQRRLQNIAKAVGKVSRGSMI